MDISFSAIARKSMVIQPQGRFIDLFCGIGGFHAATVSFGYECVFASDIDAECRKAYSHNYGLVPRGDIHAIVDKSTIPDHELLCAGFPCQPFSIIGHRKGFDDIRGTLFFQIVEVLKAKRPPTFLLENVKQLVGHDGGRTLRQIMNVLDDIGYHAAYKVLNALDFGIPQKRERVLIVGFSVEDAFHRFKWPSGGFPMRPLSDILEDDPDPKHFASKRIRASRKERHKSRYKPGIWHENKSGNITSYPYSCALRAGASHNYLLVDGERRLTAREMLRLQGFPDSFDIVCSESQTRKQVGNSVPVPMVAVAIKEILNAQQEAEAARTQANKAVNA